MVRTQISLTDAQMRQARIEAERRGISLAALVREALDRLIADSAEIRVRERARDAVGGFRSGSTATSEHHDEVLAGGTRW